jgi:hypothetical protein
MRRATVIKVLAGVALGVAGPNIAEASQRAVIPTPGGTACRTREPVLLTAGRRPRAALRLDLGSMAGRSQGVAGVDTVRSRTLLADGTWRPTSTTDKARIVLRSGRVAGGRLPVTAALHLSGSSYPKSASVTVDGIVDTLDGGVLGNHAVNDHFPQEPVGVGATWRVVNCDEINHTPATETRTYTLQSVAGGVARLAYRDIVSLDPGHLDVGSQKVGNDLVHFRLVSVSGTATGSRTIPLVRGIAESERSVTRLQVTFHAISASLPTAVIHTTMVDTSTSLPSS